MAFSDEKIRLSLKPQTKNFVWSDEKFRLGFLGGKKLEILRSENANCLLSLLVGPSVYEWRLIYALGTFWRFFSKKMIQNGDRE